MERLVVQGNAEGPQPAGLTISRLTEKTFVAAAREADNPSNNTGLGRPPYASTTPSLATTTSRLDFGLEGEESNIACRLLLADFSTLNILDCGWTP